MKFMSCSAELISCLTRTSRATSRQHSDYRLLPLAQVAAGGGLQQRHASHKAFSENDSSLSRRQSTSEAQRVQDKCRNNIKVSPSCISGPRIFPASTLALAQQREHWVITQMPPKPYSSVRSSACCISLPMFSLQEIKASL